MDVCGIDPGLNTSGYAVVRAVPGASPRILDAGVCRTEADAGLPQRLAQVQADFESLFDQWQVECVAIEQLYAHYKHPRTAVLMGHARGVIVASAARRGIAVHDFAATQIKRFLTGNGRANKAQMQRAITAAFRLSELPEPHDVADALAVAFCRIRAEQTEPMSKAVNA